MKGPFSWGGWGSCRSYAFKSGRCTKTYIRCCRVSLSDSAGDPIRDIGRREHASLRDQERSACAALGCPCGAAAARHVSLGARVEALEEEELREGLAREGVDLLAVGLHLVCDEQRLETRGLRDGLEERVAARVLQYERRAA